MRTRSLLAAATTGLLAATLLVGAARRADQAAAASPAGPGPRDVIVHLFQWPWSSVAAECVNVLGPKGFGGVQVSPPQEHVVLPGRGHPWWQDYQPVSYQLTTRRGDRAAFAGMVRTCHDAGVKIYVDAVVNHMAGGASTGTGSGGSTYRHYGYPAVPYGDGDFHHCGRNGNDDIVNWGDRWEVQNCELVDLSDLRTEAAYVRGRLTAYLNDLVSLGVDGFRVDAAKHLPAADLAAIVDPVTGSPYVFSEVIEGGAGEPTPEEYAGIGDVTEFRYGDVVGTAFRDGNLANLNNLASSMRLGSADAVAFVDNHDTQRNGRAKLTYRNGSAYALAEAFMIAWPYGVPQVMSSFTFTDPEAGPPAAGNGTTSAVDCASGWACEHRWRSTANMVGLRNAAAGAGVTNWWSNGSDQIAFGRGGAAYAAFNRAGGALTRTFQTGLPAGTYCDVLSGDFSGGSCTGTTYQVNAAGQVTATVPANGALALHVNARTSGTPGPTPPGCATVATGFEVTATTAWGENVFVVGNVAALGGWNPANAVPLGSASYPVWRGTVNLPPNTAVEYKYLRKNGDQVVWEGDPNRVRNVGAPASCAVTWTDSWR
ncbi:carbohydrate-binding module family 20 domain-containing protein [Plantactinospora sp. CA-290183]|uniref:carbohydrate-binding module family 20 domain-containing protein n=1 Tax=Plantactinospora sp. CA-290183 TaxID=3240006 RepID=UPI003D8E44CE